MNEPHRGVLGERRSMDCELIARAREGDREAFALIVDASFDRCFEIARRVLGETHLAQDATQQAMLSIWQDLPRLRDEARRGLARRP